MFFEAVHVNSVLRLQTLCNSDVQCMACVSAECTCILLLPQSATMMFPFASTATPVGALNCPFPSPCEPNLKRNSPSALNTWAKSRNLTTMSKHNHKYTKKLTVLVLSMCAYSGLRHKSIIKILHLQEKALPWQSDYENLLLWFHSCCWQPQSAGLKGHTEWDTGNKTQHMSTDEVMWPYRKRFHWMIRNKTFP